MNIIIHLLQCEKLVYAAEKGDITEVRAAITAGGDVNYQNHVSLYTHIDMYSNSIIFI